MSALAAEVIAARSPGPKCSALPTWFSAGISRTTGTGSTLPSATYYVKVVALTLEGFQNSSVLTGVATTKNITGADGKPFVLSGGSSNISAEASSPVTLPAPLLCSVTPVQIVATPRRSCQ